MRIIAGKYKGKVLVSPKTEKTRPTLDRVKEALFSIIAPYLENSKVLDLFSGTGNLGLESISRGSCFAWLNDIENYSFSNILSNVKLTNSEKYVKITKKDYIRCLSQIIEENVKFDIIFVDPPYNSSFARNTLEYISNNKGKILDENGVIIYETDKYLMKNSKQTEFEVDNLVCFDERTYGRVLLKLYKWR
ncbi:MAG: 16S rRNA (guanine(966)-N(2))-methyltransferase RsmD [Clostridia bacterium]|nr:16S rRNA (guanine(966)-N(2))-methyltransferase RsmD [Clostridia bacterium]